MELEKKKIKIIEVGLRDGLQNEKKLIPLEVKFNLAVRLLEAGLTSVEVGAFVSEKKVPSMKHTYELCVKLKKYLENKNYSLPVLVPNLEGLNKALEVGVKEVAVFISSTESFSQKNINCSIAESLNRVKSIVDLCKKNNIKVRAYLSVVFGCPYEGEVLLSKPVGLVRQLLDLEVYEVSLGDTIGIAKPEQVLNILDLLKKENVDFSKIAMHFHDTQGRALDNIKASLGQGIYIFDSSVGGLGGCPYADGATGNVATEKVLELLEAQSYFTGINLQKIKDSAKFIKSYL